MKKLSEMKTLKELEFIRFGGTKEELKAAKIIADKVKGMGLKPRFETFPVQMAKVQKCRLRVLAPYRKTIECKGYFNAGTAEKLDAPLYYMTGRDEVSLKNIKGKVVLVDGYLGYWMYKDIFEHGALGFIVYNGSLYEPNNDIDQRELRKNLKEVGEIPGVQIHAKEAYEMVQRGATRVSMTLLQEEMEGESRNVICDIKGESDQTIIFTAHYDSTALSKGSYDNASGSLALLKIAEHFASEKPYHNLRFVWCGSEERGLLGSKAYVETHKEELEEIALCINVDMIGSTMGQFVACATAEEKLVHYLEYIAKEEGFALHAYQDVYSSDSTPFADKGIPAVSFATFTNVTPIHCRHDDTKTLKRAHIKRDIGFILDFSKRMANAKIIPVKREMPENMKEKLDEYLLRKKPKGR